MLLTTHDTRGIIGRQEYCARSFVDDLWWMRLPRKRTLNSNRKPWRTLRTALVPEHRTHNPLCCSQAHQTCVIFAADSEGRILISSSEVCRRMDRSRAFSMPRSSLWSRDGGTTRAHVGYAPRAKRWVNHKTPSSRAWSHVGKGREWRHDCGIYGRRLDQPTLAISVV